MAIARSAPRTRNRVQLSCDRCRRIKRHCDRETPCGRCTQDGEECVWERANKTRRASHGIHVRQSSMPATPDCSTTAGSIQAEEIPSLSPSVQQHTAVTGTCTPQTLPPFSNVKDASLPAFVSARADTEQGHAIWKLLAAPQFLKEIVDLYVREIDWIWELFQHSRLERLLREYDDYATDAPHLWDQVKIFAMAILAITSQMSPTDVDVILMCNGAARRSASVSLHGADEVMRYAYAEVTKYVAKLAEEEPSASSWSLRKRIWSAEVFAASYLLRNYEKQTGSYRRQSENLAVDVARLQQAGYMQQPCRPCEMSKQWQIVEQAFGPQDWPTNHDALAHNVFWAYYTLDRLSTVAAGTTYAIQSMHANVCLNDVFGHTHVSHLNKVLSRDENVLCSEGATPDMPVQSPYSGAKCRFSAVASHFADRLTAIRSPAFDWDKDAESIIRDLDSDVRIFDKYVLPTIDNPSDRFSKAKRLTLALCIELLRASIASQLHIVFAATLFRRSLGIVTISASARQQISWELQKRRLESAKSLIGRVLAFGNATLLFRSSWPFFASSVFVQITEICTILKEHFDLKLNNFNDLAKREQLIEYLQSALKGRNLLALLARNNELPLTQAQVRSACQGVGELLRMCGATDAHVAATLDVRAVIDDDAAVEAVGHAFNLLSGRLSALDTLAASATQHLAPYPTPPDEEGLLYPSTTASAAVEKNWDNIFTDLAELERLFTAPMVVDLSTTSADS